ncbi:MAG: GNAT family N-acetyltransferase [Actinomycetia bacterium]|jgi:[ribosomal protein S5]-alanine N-acetyltransferase|nr:GNAT family N-acetyltransferase [Actinomycetes bacterium]
MTVSGFWPVTLTNGEVTLRPMRFSDRRAWREVRKRNGQWLQQWDATMPPEGRLDGQRPPTYNAMMRIMKKEAREGRALPFAIEVGGKFVGQITVGGIWGGSSRGAFFGYWIDERVAGRGLMTQCVELAADYCLETMLLHRIEINVRPENAASRRVAIKAGFTEESYRPRYLHIDGDWRDHIGFVKFRDTPN